MNKILAAALAGTFALAGCGGAAEKAPEAEETASLDAGTSVADMSPTLEGSGDMSSAAGAGADTAAMDGGRAGADGPPPVAEGEGGPGDALDKAPAD
jgi:hypothetical protein